MSWARCHQAVVAQIPAALTGRASRNWVGPMLAEDVRRWEATLDAEYVREHLHLAYATTVHGVQGVTATQ